MPIFSVENLNVEFSTFGGSVKAVRGVSYRVDRGQTLAIVGESGCGKSVSVMASMGLIPMPPGRITRGSAKLNGKELLGLSTREINRVRGTEVGMIFQDPMTSLNPTMKIGRQIAETLVAHRGMRQRAAFSEAVNLLHRTRIAEPARCANQYPFELSGGMLQRAMIAMALACKPMLLIADEPTTALDVTIQNEVLELMRDLQRAEGMAIVLITHDLGVVARMADHVAVMYAGKIVESGSVDHIFYRAAHPYTRGLKAASPDWERCKSHRLKPVSGSPPDLFAWSDSCGFNPRCPQAMNICVRAEPDASELTAGHSVRCWLYHPLATHSTQRIERQITGCTDAD